MKLILLLAVPLFIFFASCEKTERHIVPTEGLILYYNFDGNMTDQSQSHNDGIDSTSGKYVEGRWKKALDFDGKNDFMILTRSLNAENGLTFSFWLKSRGAAENENNGAIISKYNMTGHKRCFMIYSFGSYDSRSDNRLSAAFYEGGIYPMVNVDHVKSFMLAWELEDYANPLLWTIVEPAKLATGKWVHCVVNTSDEEIQIWLDGELCVKKAREYEFYYDDPEEPTYIGNNMNGGEGRNNHFNGVLDDFLVYSRTLTPDEIQTLYLGR